MNPASSALFVRSGSATVDDTARAVFVRAPPAPPGRTSTVTTGQSAPGVQTGSVAMEQMRRRLVPPVEAVAQLRPLAAPGASATETSPAPAGPTASLMSPVRSSVSVIEAEGCGPAFAISIVKVCTSPAATVASAAAFETKMSAESPPVLPSTVTEVVSLAGLVSAMLASGELTVMLFVIVPVAVAVVRRTTAGVVAPGASGAPEVKTRSQVIEAAPATGAAGAQVHPFSV